MRLEDDRYESERLCCGGAQAELRQPTQVCLPDRDDVGASDLETAHLIARRLAQLDIDRVEERAAVPVLFVRAQRKMARLDPMEPEGTAADPLPLPRSHGHTVAIPGEIPEKVEARRRPIAEDA